MLSDRKKKDILKAISKETGMSVSSIYKILSYPFRFSRQSISEVRKAAERYGFTVSSDMPATDTCREGTASIRRILRNEADTDRLFVHLREQALAPEANVVCYDEIASQRATASILARKLELLFESEGQELDCVYFANGGTYIACSAIEKLSRRYSAASHTVAIGHELLDGDQRSLMEGRQRGYVGVFFGPSGRYPRFLPNRIDKPRVLLYHMGNTKKRGNNHESCSFLHRGRPTRREKMSLRDRRPPTLLSCPFRLRRYSFWGRCHRSNSRDLRGHYPRAYRRAY